jgi:deoxyribodipyrimidine photo-lyase
MTDDAAPAPHIPRGGRAAALAVLDRIRPAAYARTRNFLNGAVTRLSPYLRHGILSLPEVRDAALQRAPGTQLEKFVQELAWREYYQRVYDVLGEQIWDDVEPYKTGRTAASYDDELPDDIANATTGLACMDGFVTELRESGYLHNHARMWFASYVVHFREVRWQAGALFFLAHLLDGDPASNNLSWQWVASTFAHKPYVFNRANLERYSDGAYCNVCPLQNAGCPFATSYERLDARLFPHGQNAVEGFERPDMHVSADERPAATPIASDAIVWQHDESLSPSDPARAYALNAPAIFVWDETARERDPWSALRRTFVAQTLEELELARIANGDASTEIARFAREHDARTIVTTAPVSPALKATARRLASEFTLEMRPAARMAPLDRDADLARFSRYWSKAKRYAFGDPADSGEPLRLL